MAMGFLATASYGQISRGDRYSGATWATRSPVLAQHGMAATEQPLASQIAIDILKKGGSAVDAAIAANAAIGLMQPVLNGIGGDLFAIVYEAKTGALHGLNASGWAPKALTPSFMRQHGFARMPDGGIHTVTVPGAVAGWEALRGRLGTLPLSDLLAPAIWYADEGFPVSDVIAAHWASLADTLAAEPNAARTYLPGGRPPAAGEIFRNPDLAGSLRRIAADGPAGFYEGQTADAILAISREKGGTLDAADLREMQPE
ncbi:MAG TPA: gamma-glutamyltransferase, partial [Rhizomicrobium sp.]